MRVSRCRVSDADYAGQIEDLRAVTNFDYGYYERCDVDPSIRNGFSGELVRGITYEKLGEDLLPNSACAFNIICKEIDYGSYAGTWHPDGIQMYSVNENLIYQHIRAYECRAQLIFQGDSLTPAKDVAIVDALFREKSGSGFVSQLLSGLDHLMLIHVHADQTLRIDETEPTLTDLLILNSYFDSLSAQGGNIALVEAAGRLDSNSWGNDGACGVNPSPGSGLAFVSEAGRDYRLTSSADGYQAATPTVPFAFPSGVRGPTDAAQPDIGPFSDASNPSVLFAQSQATPSGRTHRLTRPGRLL